nr:hypothetical protein [uncultured Desulfobacter sp.]
MAKSIITAIFACLTAVLTSLIALWAGGKKLKNEILGSHNSLLIEKQINACEDLWRVLALLSFSSKTSIVKMKNSKETIISKQNAKDFISQLMEIFYSPSGLYFSFNVRKCLFELRGFIAEEILSDNEADETSLSDKKLNLLKDKRNKLIISIREEIGVIDLQATKNRGNENQSSHSN